MKVRLTQGVDSENGWLEKGTTIEDDDAHHLCAAGLAEPVDDEAKAAFEQYQKRTGKLRKKPTILAPGAIGAPASAAAPSAPAADPPKAPPSAPVLSKPGAADKEAAS